MMIPTLSMTDPYPRAADPVAASGGARVRLPRRGARPLTFSGHELAMAMSFTPGLPYWYEITIYRTNDQRFVLWIRQFFVSEQEKDTSDAWMFDALPEVLDALEAYDAGRDVVADVGSARPGMAPAELAAQAMELRARVEQARHHFASLLGEFFAEMDGAAEAA
jgi:hypothetical protein